MSAIAIVLMILGAVLIFMIIGGVVAADRRRDALDAELRRRLAEANNALADARSQDRGWERETIEAVAREAFAAGNPGLPVRELYLVQVVDRPGTDNDEAVFEIRTDDSRLHSVTLGRRDGAWTAL